MKRIYVATIHRQVDPNRGGELGNIYVLDWESKKLLVDPRGVDPGYSSLYSPRGRSHGVRGIAFMGDKIYVAGSGSSVSRFNSDSFELEHVKVLEEANHIHQIKTFGIRSKGALFVVSTGTDRLLGFDGHDKVYLVEDLSDLGDMIDPFLRRGHDKRAWGEDKLHFNSIGWDDKGKEYHVYGAADMVFNFSDKEIILQGGPLSSPHDILFHKGRLIVSSSGDCTTLAVDVETKDVSVVQKLYRSSDFAPEYNSWGFTRGLACSEDLLFACSAPTEINTFRLTEDRGYLPEESFNISQDPFEAIYDILLDPRDWEEQ